MKYGYGVKDMIEETEKLKHELRLSNGMKKDIAGILYKDGVRQQLVLNKLI